MPLLPGTDRGLRGSLHCRADRGLRGSLHCIQWPGSAGYTTATLVITSAGLENSAWPVTQSGGQPWKFFLLAGFVVGKLDALRLGGRTVKTTK